VQTVRKQIATKTKAMVKTTVSARTLIHEYTDTSKGSNTGYYCSQGGCTDGAYMYYYLLPVAGSNVTVNTAGRISKVRLSDGKTTNYKTGLKLFKGNDLAYNPDTGLIYVATQYQPDSSSSRIDIIDPGTLELVGQKIVPFYISAIAYEPTRGVFVGALGGTTIYTFKIGSTGDFETVKQFSVTSSPCYTDGWTSQGIACDGAFIYHTWYMSGVVRIEVFDWSGNYLGYMTWTPNIEIEWLDKIGKNKFLVGFYTDGGIKAYTFTTS
jgi:hypothetical protein